MCSRTNICQTLQLHMDDHGRFAFVQFPDNTFQLISIVGFRMAKKSPFYKCMNYVYPPGISIINAVKMVFLR